MIALTQEKREALVEYANDVLAFLVQHGSDSDEKDIFKIALASLTADIFAHVDGSGLNFYRHPSATIEHAIEQGDQVTALYISPPVPEVNTSNELTALLRAIESFQAIQANDRWNESGKLDDAYSELSETAIKAAPLIKRLNGWGE